MKNLILFLALFPALTMAEDPALHGAWEAEWVEHDEETEQDISVYVRLAFEPGGGFEWDSSADYASLVWESLVALLYLIAVADADDLDEIEELEVPSPLPALWIASVMTGTYEIVDGQILYDVTQVTPQVNGLPIEEGFYEYMVDLIFPWVAEVLEIPEEDYPIFEEDLLAHARGNFATQDDLEALIGGDLPGPHAGMLCDLYTVDGDELTLIFLEQDDHEGGSLILTRGEAASDVGTAVAPIAWGRLKEGVLP